MRGFLLALRAAVTYTVAVPATVLYALAIIAVAMASPSSPALDRVARSWGRVWCRAAGVKLAIVGLEHIETDRSYVVVSNHRSNFDIFAHFAALPVPIRFLAKTELFKIPLFGTAMQRFGIVEVDRGAGRAIHQSINKGARKNMERGRSLMIYPEGTRPRDGVMLGFKKGAFSIARNLRASVLPTAISGSREVWKPGSKLIRPGTITVEIMAPIPTEDMMIYEVGELRDRVHTRISEAIGRPAPAEGVSR